jgi:hypothetical protein
MLHSWDVERKSRRDRHSGGREGRTAREREGGGGDGWTRSILPRCARALMRRKSSLYMSASLYIEPSRALMRARDRKRAAQETLRATDKTI